MHQGHDKDKRYKKREAHIAINIVLFYVDRLRAGTAGFESRHRQKIFLNCTAFRPLCAHPTNYKIGTGGSLPGIKRPGV
jgi:hypothetical protein